MSVCPYDRMSTTFWGRCDYFINEYLFCKYFARLSVSNATKGFATYGWFHPCFYTFSSRISLSLSNKIMQRDKNILVSNVFEQG